MSTPKTGSCSLCAAPIDDLTSAATFVITGGEGRPTPRAIGRYCGPACRAAVEAVDAVRGLQEDDVIADALLALYRSGRGPSPTLVLEAVQRVYTARRDDHHDPFVECVHVACA